MLPRRYVAGVIVSLAFAAGMTTGCAETTGTPVADTNALATTTAPTTTTTGAAAPTGEPVGTAVMAVRGGDAPVTLRYRINGGPEQTETDVTLPWEKEYPVYDELQSEVSADGGDTELICTIIMDGDKLVSFVTEPRPTCSFAYWG